MDFAADHHLVSPLAHSDCSVNYFAQNTQRGPEPLGWRVPQTLAVGELSKSKF